MLVKIYTRSNSEQLVNMKEWASQYDIYPIRDISTGQFTLSPHIAEWHFFDTRLQLMFEMKYSDLIDDNLRARIQESEQLVINDIRAHTLRRSLPR